MSYDSNSRGNSCYCGRNECDGRNCCELCGNYYCGNKHCPVSQLVSVNCGDYRCTDCLNEDDTVVIALESASGYSSACHKCGLDIYDKPYSDDKPFVIGNKILHWECLEDIVREIKLPTLQHSSELESLDDENTEDKEEIFLARNFNCCEHAVTVPCVCIYSYKCKICTNDLQVCHGSHS